MMLDISVDLRDIKIIPTSEIEEIVQNVKMILATNKFSVPMDRTFGLNASLTDMPIAASRARLTAEIATAIHEQEPRARVRQVSYSVQDVADGQLKPRVKIEIIEKLLRGGVF